MVSKDFYTKTKWTKYLRLQHYQNLAEMVFDTVKEHPEWTAMRWFKEDSDDLEAITYSQLGDIITTAFYGLHSLGLKKGEHISLCAETSQLWAWADLGIQCVGGVTVAIYPVLTPSLYQSLSSF